MGATRPETAPSHIRGPRSTACSRPARGAAGFPSSSELMWFRVQAFPGVGDQIFDSQPPNTNGVNVTASSAFLSGATSIPVSNCYGIHPNASGIDPAYGQTVNVYDVTTVAQVGTATSCSNGVLSVNAGASAGGASGDTLAVGVNTHCDWAFWYDATVAYCACNPANPYWFPVNGAVVSPNVHNLWAYWDGAGTYPPVYMWVSPSGNASCIASCLYSTATDPGTPASNYFTTISASLAQMNTTKGFINGGVVCIPQGVSVTSLSTGSATLTSTTNTPKPGVLITGAPSGGTCPASGTYMAASIFPTITNYTLQR